MKDIAWDMSDDTIVRKLGERARQETLPDPSLQKVKQGERMRFDAHVNVESLPAGKHLKKATIFSNVPDAGVWEIISDEGTAVGGRGTAPSPIMYFATGLALCMMSHVEMLAASGEFAIDAARLEQRASFSTTMDLGAMSPRDVFGRGERVEIHLLIESSDPPEKVAEFVAYCRQACMSLQAIAAPVPSVTALFLNGEEIGEVGGTGPHDPDAV
jgi:uncharacterized OsmC-like protein